MSAAATIKVEVSLRRPGWLITICSCVSLFTYLMTYKAATSDIVANYNMSNWERRTLRGVLNIGRRKKYCFLSNHY